MAEISFRNVSRAENGRNQIRDFSLDIHSGEFLIIAGPANSGKATILRMIAGTEPIDEGELTVDGEETGIGKLKKRNVGMIFQNYTLYPGMTVRENLAFRMKLKGEKEEKILSNIADTAEIFNIENLLDCYPRELNDLQKQYVAMARAQVHEPIAFLILDCLQRLSPAERSKARKRLAELHEKIGRTLVYVTDSGKEVRKLNKHTVIMRNGMIEQEGTVEELLDKPANLFVAQFMNEPGSCSSMVHINRTQSTVEALAENFGLDVPEIWKERLEKNGFIGRDCLMGFTFSGAPEEDDEELKPVPDPESRVYFFDPVSEKIIL